MYALYFIIAILIICICILCYFFYKYYVKNKKEKLELLLKITMLEDKNQKMNMDYEKDCKFLNNRINEVINNNLQMIIVPLAESSNTIINNHKLQKLVIETTKEIYNSMSDNYIENILFKYFTKQSLSDYIVRVSYNRLLDEINKSNFKKISK